MSTLRGSCLCGKVAFEVADVSAESAKQTSLCHCLPCRKITGSLFSVNLTVPADSLKLTKGELKKFSTTHPEAGFAFTLYFCADCATPLYAAPDGAPVAILQVGTLDDNGSIGSTPVEELNIKHRVGWCQKIPGATQKTTYTD